MAKGAPTDKNDNSVYLINRLVGDPAAYVGSTTNLNRRISEHSRRGVITSFYGNRIVNNIKDFQVVGIDVGAKDSKELKSWERFYISLFGTYSGENEDFGINIVKDPSLSISKEPIVSCRISSSNKGRVTPEETKEKIRASTKGKIHLGVKRPYLSERNKIIKPTLGRVGEMHPMSKKIEDFNSGIIFESIKDAADYYGISRQGMRYRIKCTPNMYKVYE